VTASAAEAGPDPPSGARGLAERFGAFGAVDAIDFRSLLA
jgi:hypothetical protein